MLFLALDRYRCLDGRMMGFALTALAFLKSAPKWPWKLIGCVAAAFLVFALLWWLRDSSVRLGAAQERARWETRLAEAERDAQHKLQERDNQITRLTIENATARARITLNTERAHAEIRAAAPANEAPIDPHLVAVWRAGLTRLCVAAPGADANFADTCRPDA